MVPVPYLKGRIIVRHHVRKNSTVLRLSAYVAILAATAVRPAASQTNEEQDRTAVVISAKTVLKAKPSAEAEVVLQAGRDTDFKVTGSTEGWVKVAIKGGGEGWLPEAEVGLKIKRGGKVCVEVSLEKALDLGALNGAFRGTGSSSGDSVVLRAKNELTAEICPKFEPGMVLENQNAQAQNMVISSLSGRPSGATTIVPEVELHFEPGIEAEYIFEAYCINFDKDNPATSDRLTPRGAAAGDLAKVLANRSDNLKAFQLAIWAITDNVSPHDANEKFDGTAADIDSARKLVEAAGLTASRFRLFQ
jgi:hypothetical protein